MGKYDHLSKEELIQRIERLEADLEKATLTPSASDNELEMRQSQHTINFLNILMDTILSNVFVEITVKDIFNGFRYIYFNKAADFDVEEGFGHTLQEVREGGGIYGGQGGRYLREDGFRAFP